MSAAPLVHVVDDDDSLRTAVARLLNAAGLEVRAYASAGDFLLHPLPHRPGCILLDLRMPGPSGLELQRALRTLGATLPVIFFTAHADVACSVEAMKAGAVDFLMKPVEPQVLLEAVQRALERDARMRAARTDADDLLSRFALLSPREREVFDLVVAGKLNKQIADELGIAERTVKAQRAQLMIKLGAESAAELGRLAERLQRLTQDLPDNR
ncbi:response regulator transcription factor [Xanthobacter dioxanivorans]|uniref:Response regulator transcription factor n=1 Tax=Xanthobacter dioxanivorans TaxID=2528964 RepID=A0A974PS37_9HYPH|nr:response regulator [Xanthobacter dioxanivorans]QRG08491.1 response regulator transcription factor [Xanthobacter dioxanivorans]